MSKAVMLSIRPKWCEKIASGEKTVEVRKTRPKLGTPFKCYIYCTQSGVALGACGKHGKVIGEFTCDRIDEYDDDTIFSFRHEDYTRWNDFGLDRACMHPEDFQNYADGKWLYGWHISGLKIYDTPKELTEFHTLKKCKSCSKSGYESTACIYDENCMVPVATTKAPQSWCYVEDD
jgi:predicted transcriptional regulator